MNSEELIRAGQAAKALLESDDFKIGLKAVRDMAQESWTKTEPAQVKEREEFYYLILATNVLEAHFRSLAESGRFEQRKVVKAEEASRAANQGEE